MQKERRTTCPDEVARSSLSTTDLPRRQLRAKAQKRGNALYFDGSLASSTTSTRVPLDFELSSMGPDVSSECLALLHASAYARTARARLARATKEKLRKLATTRFRLRATVHPFLSSVSAR